MLILRRNIQAPCLLRRGMAYNLSALGEFSTGSTREYSTGVDSDGIWSVGRLRQLPRRSCSDCSKVVGRSIRHGLDAQLLPTGSWKQFLLSCLRSLDRW